MEFIFEFLFELILEGTIELGTSRRVPPVVRILALLVVMAVFGGLTVLLVVVGISMLQENNIPAAVFFFAIGALILSGAVYAILKRWKR